MSASNLQDKELLWENQDHTESFRIDETHRARHRRFDSEWRQNVGGPHPDLGLRTERLYLWWFCSRLGASGEMLSP